MKKELRPISCPNCGGEVNGSKCQYCGSIFWDIADIELNKPAWIRLRYNGKTIVVKAIPTDISFELNTPSNITCYADNAPLYIGVDPDRTLHMNFYIISHGKRREYSRVVMDECKERDYYINMRDEED